MSLYNELFSENEDAMALLGFAGLTRNEFMRYRDVYLRANGTEIIVYTRLGGDNRKAYQDTIRKLRQKPNYIKDFDDDYDCTYAYFIFSPLDEYKDTCQKMKPEKDMDLVGTRFQRHFEQMNIPGTPEYEKSMEMAERLNRMIEAAINSDDDFNIFKI